MKSRYLQLTFKSARKSISVWEAITVALKGLVHFLQREERMNSEI